MSILSDLRSIPRRLAARDARRQVLRRVRSDDHHRVLLEVVDEIAQELVASGAATLEEEWEKGHLGWDGPTLRLTPRNPAAASVELGASLDETFVIVGEHRLQHELWGSWPEERRQPLRDCLRAVVEGRVRASRESHWSGPMERLLFDSDPEPAESCRYGIGGDPRPWPRPAARRRPQARRRLRSGRPTPPAASVPPPRSASSSPRARAPRPPARPTAPRTAPGS